MRGVWGTAFVIASALSLAACGSSKMLLPSASSGTGEGFQSYDAVETAYDQVVPGKTNTAELAKLGFNVKTSPNIEVLDYVGVVEMLPKDARSKGHVPAPVQTCVDAGDRCMAYAFHPQRHEVRHVGNTALELTGFEEQTINSGWSADVMLLIQNDVVVYKLMSGQPLMANMKRRVQPLGPLQNAGRAAVKGQDTDNNDKEN